MQVAPSPTKLLLKLWKLKKLAVWEENTMVARVQLHNMRQDRDKTISSFGAHLRGQAGVSKFLVTCPGCNEEVNYTENVLFNVLTRGLADRNLAGIKTQVSKKSFNLLR